jgi:hypothetical protein
VRRLVKRRATLAQLEAALQVEEDLIDAAYWRFCRAARALPPVLAEPRAYRRRVILKRAIARRRTD